MEDEFLTDSSSAAPAETKPTKTSTQIMQEHLPYYLEAGMTYEQYWDGDVEMTVGYRKALDRRREWQNQMLWLQGLYFYKALYAIMPALSIKTKAQIEPYLEEPIPITVKAEKEKKERDERRQFDENFAALQRLATAFNAKYQKKGGESTNG